MRTILGVDARSDLLKAMLPHVRSDLSASDFRYLGYSKRNLQSASPYPDLSENVSTLDFTSLPRKPE